jgi:spore coat protein U-like protein
MNKLKFIIIFLVFIFISSAKSYASVCSVSSPTISFGQYDARPGALNTSTTTVTVTCSDMKTDTPYVLTLYKSKQSFSMSHGADTLYYQLFTSANYTTVWDDKNSISGIVRNNGGNGSDTRTVYGKIIINQIGKKSGAYNSGSDPVIINLIYTP